MLHRELKERREELGYDIYQGADCFGMDIEKYRMYEEGTKKAPHKVWKDMLKRYNQLLGVDGKENMELGYREEFAFFVKSMRKSIAYSRHDFSNCIGLDKSTYDKLESGTLKSDFDYDRYEQRIKKVVRDALKYGGDEVKRMGRGDDVWTNEKVKELKDLVSRGKNCTQIAVRLGVNEGHVKKKCGDMGIGVNKYKFYMTGDRLSEIG